MGGTSTPPLELCCAAMGRAAKAGSCKKDEILRPVGDSEPCDGRQAVWVGAAGGAVSTGVGVGRINHATDFRTESR